MTTNLQQRSPLGPVRLETPLIRFTAVDRGRSGIEPILFRGPRLELGQLEVITPPVAPFSLTTAPGTPFPRSHGPLDPTLGVADGPGLLSNPVSDPVTDPDADPVTDPVSDPSAPRRRSDDTERPIACGGDEGRAELWVRFDAAWDGSGANGQVVIEHRASGRRWPIDLVAMPARPLRPSSLSPA